MFRRIHEFFRIVGKLVTRHIAHVSQGRLNGAFRWILVARILHIKLDIFYNAQKDGQKFLLKLRRSHKQFKTCILIIHAHPLLV